MQQRTSNAPPLLLSGTWWARLGAVSLYFTGDVLPEPPVPFQH